MIPREGNTVLSALMRVKSCPKCLCQFPRTCSLQVWYRRLSMRAGTTLSTYEKQFLSASEFRTSKGNKRLKHSKSRTDEISSSAPLISIGDDPVEQDRTIDHLMSLLEYAVTASNHSPDNMPKGKVSNKPPLPSKTFLGISLLDRYILYALAVSLQRMRGHAVKGQKEEAFDCLRKFITDILTDDFLGTVIPSLQYKTIKGNNMGNKLDFASAEIGSMAWINQISAYCASLLRPFDSKHRVKTFMSRHFSYQLSPNDMIKFSQALESCLEGFDDVKRLFAVTEALRLFAKKNFSAGGETEQSSQSLTILNSEWRNGLKYSCILFVNSTAAFSETLHNDLAHGILCKAGGIESIKTVNSKFFSRARFAQVDGKGVVSQKLFEDLMMVVGDKKLVESLIGDGVLTLYLNGKASSKVPESLVVKD